ncbi:hypothetical protein PTKIN_Ptkin14bG0194100 [Pterospermum kingtungense]
MESKLVLGNSLIVPSVKELAKEVMSTNIPPRHLHPDLDLHQTINSDDNPMPEIPVIDLQRLLGEEDSIDSELAKLDFACKQWGFFQEYLVNHGVSSCLVEKIKAEIQDLFNLPMEEKKKF